MTWTAKGSLINDQSNAPTTVALSNVAVGDLIVLSFAFNSATIWVSALSGGGVTWDPIQGHNLGIINGYSTSIFTGKVTATGSQTVTITYSGSGVTTQTLVTEGFEFASSVGSWTVDGSPGFVDETGQSNFPSLTPAGAGELYAGGGEDNGTAVAGSTSGYVFSPDAGGNGFCYNLNCTSAAQAPVWGDSGWGDAAAILVKETAAAPAFAAVRYVPSALLSPAPWEQRPYRSIPGAVDTPANPLVSPLDTAWQADGQYSHLYRDAHLRDRRQYFYQPPRAFDPNLLGGAANADPLALNPEQSNSSDLWRIAVVPAFYDRREVPQQRQYFLPPSPFELENELLGGAETGKYYRVAATHADRREVPQQRQYYDTTLLLTAELENELLGGAETPKYYRTPATHAARWWMPQQPPRLADPLLIATALLENELLGGAATWLHYVTSAYIDRREVPQQRAYISDPSFYPPQNNLDTLLAGQDYLDSHQHQAATHYDRREVPQQRLYISDPSFYPTGAATDPLTVAWGAGGPYWHLYNRAADIGDRREYFTQRLYQSDPLLLLSALLENELLGGAETGKYYRTPATHAARWWMPQQPARLADPLLIQTAELENELLGGGGTSRYYLAAGYWDRREVPQQRPYISDPSFYPSGAVTDPLTVAWGAGGGYWHLYNRAGDDTDRRLVPQQRAYVSDPLLLTTAELENELLGGAGTAMRYLLAATHADRREVPAQRQFFPLPQLFLDPTQSAWAFLRLAYNLAATHYDRRLYPQQRLYFPLPAPPPPFTVGTLTASGAPAGVLTAAAAASALTAATAAGSALTAADQRTGGPS